MAVHTIKVNLAGGVVSPGDLQEILEIAEGAGANHVRIGNRQQLYFTVRAENLEDLELEMFKAELTYEVDNHQYPNILSSYVTDDIFSAESWLREGVYKDIFDLFNYQPKLKINLIDQYQTFVPFFTGNFNFITSVVSNYWYWYIRFPKTNATYCWPALIYSADIPQVSKLAEQIILENKDLFYDQPETDHKLFHRLLSNQIKVAAQAIKEPLKLPEFQLPYYEGFNHYGNRKYWLGIYRRNEIFSINLLKDICAACFKTRIGQLYTTPWKSLIIKGINEADCESWRHLLNKHRINVRHAYNELNWQLENLCEESLEMKKQLVKELEEDDVRTYKLCFAIKIHPKSGLMGSVVVRKRDNGLFDISHTRDFNPNTKEYIAYKTGVEACRIGNHLGNLCNTYYELLSSNLAPGYEPKPDTSNDAEPEKQHFVYQCRHCFTLYDPAFGDEMNNIAPHTKFEDLADYACPVCDAEKEAFAVVAW